MKIIERIVESTGEPNKNDLWLDTKSGKPRLKMYAGGEWVNAAGQDYNIVAPKYADVIAHDAAALGVLAGHLERGTIFDCILFGGVVETNEGSMSRPICAGNQQVIAFDSADSELATILVYYTQTQYEGLAAVQEALELKDRLPTLLSEGIQSVGLCLYESYTETFICCEGKYVKVEDDGTIAAISVSSIEVSPEVSYANVSFEDLQKLIGLPLA